MHAQIHSEEYVDPNLNKLWKSGAVVILPFYLSPLKHSYTALYGNFTGQHKDYSLYSCKVYLPALYKKGIEVEDFIMDRIKILAECKGLSGICGNWGYTVVDNTVYYCGQFLVKNF